MADQVRRILVPIDFSQPSLHALAYAEGLARRLGAELRLLHVLELPSHVQGLSVAHGLYGAPPYAGEHPPGAGEEAAPQSGSEQLAQALHERLAALAAESSQPCSSTVRRGHPVDEILREIEDFSPDLVVMGTHGWTGLRHFVLGSVAEKVVRLSPVPVLSLRNESRG